MIGPRRAAPAALAALIGALVLASCSVGSLSPRQQAARRSFVDQVHAQVPDIGSYRSDVQLIRLGATICSDLGAHATVEEVADRVPLGEGTTVLPPAALGSVIAAAVSSICPRYHALMAGGGTAAPAG